MKRYAVGGLCGTVAFAATYGLLIVGRQASSGRPVRIRNVANLALALSFIKMVTLAALQGPILLLIRRFGGDLAGRGAIALAVIGIAPLGAFAAWLMFRENTETVAGPDAIMFFDDLEANVQAARSVGLQARRVRGVDELRRQLKTDGVPL